MGCGGSKAQGKEGDGKKPPQSQKPIAKDTKEEEAKAADDASPAAA